MRMNQELAAAIALELFTDGERKVARRLVLEYDERIDGPGLSAYAVAGCIQNFLDQASFNPPNLARGGSQYVYVETPEGPWTVGFYDPHGSWNPESDHASRAAAAERVAWLNGSISPNLATRIERATRDLERVLAEIGGGA